MNSCRGFGYRTAVIVLISLHALLVAGCAMRYGVAWTEGGLLPTGIYDWKYGTFDVFRVSPPLVRMWAVLPALALDPEIPFRGASHDPRDRQERELSRTVFRGMPDEAHLWLKLGRLFCLPFVIAGAWFTARWAEQVYGKAAAVGAAFLWCFSPSLIGSGGLISGDAQAASMGIVTLYLFRSWLLRPSFSSAYLLGLVAGLTMLTKSSWLILLALLPALWLLIRGIEWFKAKWALGSRNSASARIDPLAHKGWRARAGMEAGSLALAMVLSLVVVNLIYGFGGTFRRLDSYDFISRSLAGTEDWQPRDWSGNRFRGTWLGALPVPLPKQLMIGVDLQKWDFDRERWSYFRGEWRTQGWWYYYLYGLAIKVPLGAWLLFFVAMIGMIVRSSRRASWQDELLLFIPPLLVLTGASLETGLNRHLRYVLPALPFLIVIASRAFLVFAEPRLKLRGVVTFASAWFVASSLWIYPHSLSYFNELIGGPRHGERHLNASNLDWGQDLPYLRRWQQANPHARPLWVNNWVAYIRPEHVGVEHEGLVPSLPEEDASRHQALRRRPEPRFQPGWYAIDRETLLSRSGDYEYLRSLEPVDWAGYAFHIYRITPEQAAEFERRWRMAEEEARETAGGGEDSEEPGSRVGAEAER